MADRDAENRRAEALWKRGWFVGGLAASFLILVGVLLGLILEPDADLPAVPTTSSSLTQQTTSASDPSESRVLTTPSTVAPTTTTNPTVESWDSSEDAVASMVQCGEIAECEVEWGHDGSTAQDMPESISGYGPSGPVERTDFRVLGDGSAAVTTTFPYLLGDCATQIWTARWRSVTGESISGAVIPATPDAPFDLPWNADWGEPPAPSQSGFLAGFGCSQPAWTFIDTDPEFVVIADGVVEWQLWLATP